MTRSRESAVNRKGSDGNYSTALVLFCHPGLLIHHDATAKSQITFPVDHQSTGRQWVVVAGPGGVCVCVVARGGKKTHHSLCEGCCCQAVCGCGSSC
jgi:hypothetical protein